MVNVADLILLLRATIAIFSLAKFILTFFKNYVYSTKFIEPNVFIQHWSKNIFQSQIDITLSISNGIF